MTNYTLHATYRSPMFYYVHKQQHVIKASCYALNERLWDVYPTYEDATAALAMRCL